MEDKLEITTTAGEKFTGKESMILAQLIYKRFGKDTYAAHRAWCRMLENNCSMKDFEKVLYGKY